MFTIYIEIIHQVVLGLVIKSVFHNLEVVGSDSTIGNLGMEPSFKEPCLFLKNEYRK